MSQELETLIGRIVHDKLPVEWMRYNMFFSKNIYHNIPMLVFRLNEEDISEDLKNLMLCVENFKGKCIWKVYKDPLSKKGNYLLTLAITENIRKDCYDKKSVYDEQKYFKKEELKRYCEQAINDIPVLAEHISRYLK